MCTIVPEILFQCMPVIMDNICIFMQSYNKNNCKYNKK